MLRWLFLFWLCLEVAGFIWVGEWLGLGWTLLLIIGSAVVGVALLRQQGLRAANVMIHKMRAGQPASAADFADMPFVMLGAILLIIPGFFSDILGLLCFLPPIRQFFVRVLSKTNQQSARTKRSHTRVDAGRTFEGEYQKKDEN